MALQTQRNVRTSRHTGTTHRVHTVAGQTTGRGAHGTIHIGPATHRRSGRRAASRTEVPSITLARTLRATQTVGVAVTASWTLAANSTHAEVPRTTLLLASALGGVASLRSGEVAGFHRHRRRRGGGAIH